MIFEKSDIPFFEELEKTNQIILKENKEYSLYDAPTWQLAQKIDALMGNDDIGYYIDDYIINKNVNI